MQAGNTGKEYCCSAAIVALLLLLCLPASLLADSAPRLRPIEIVAPSLATCPALQPLLADIKNQQPARITINQKPHNAGTIFWIICNELDIPPMLAADNADNYALLLYFDLQSYLSIKSQLSLRHTVLLTNPSPQRQLQLIKIAVPTARKVGLLLRPEHHADYRFLATAANKLGLELNLYAYSQSEDTNRTLNRLLRENDTLLALKDDSLYNASTIRRVLMTSYRRNKPVIGLSPAFVKAGVLATSYSSQTQYLNSARKLLSEMLTTGAQNDALLPYQFSTEYSIYTNKHVQHSLNLTPLTAKAIKQALEADTP